MFRSCPRPQANPAIAAASTAPTGRWLPVIIVALALVAGLGVSAPVSAQGQTTVTITPSSRVVVGVDTVRVTVLWCGYPPNLFDPDSRSIKVNSVDVTSNFDLEWDPIACGFYGEVSDELFYKSTGTITLSSPSSTVTADVWDWSRTYLYSAPSQVYKIPDPRRRVVVVPEAQFVEVRPNTPQTQRFTIYNSGPVRDTFAVSRTCTGMTSGCSLSASSVALDAAQSTTVTVSDSSHSVGDTGTVTLRAARNADATFADSSWTDVKVTAGASPGVAIVGTAPGANGTVERGLCVTVAAGDGAAAECGDLRLVHALPGVRTLGAQRTPTLLYNSQHARPTPLVVADVTLPTTGQVPDTVRAVILVGGVARGTASWLGPQWGSLGATRRIVVPADASSFWDTVRICTFKLQVRYIWGNNYNEDTSSTQHLPVVSRAQSPFGAGWWLAGLERVEVMSSTQLEWIGGDGSARVYTKDGGSSVYRTASLTRPDTIVAVNSNYVRYAAGGAKVWFSTAGLHDSTVNRLLYVTSFTYSSGRLTSMQVPTTGSPLTYTFTYNGSGILDSVTAPSTGGAARNVKVWTNGMRVDSIRDPDGSRVRFAYGSGTNQYRASSRTDRLGKVTTFGWNDAAQRLNQVQRPLSRPTTLAFAETKGLSSAVVVDSAYTSIDGPRTDVADVTKIWINSYGAPTRIRNAVGRETQISYDATWPGLAAVTKGPSGLRTRAWYSGRGLPDSTIAYNPLGTGQNAVTRYQWDATWDEATQVTSPTGLVTTFGYNATYGNRSWEQVGPDQARRVAYGYDAYRLLYTVTTPSGTQYLTYDALGNLYSNQNPRGFTSYAYGDAIGRDTLVAGTLDSLPSTSLRWSRTRTFFNVLDLVDSARTTGDGVETPTRTHHADTVVVRHTYDAEAQRLSTTRAFRLNGAVRSLTSTWWYDDAGRVARDTIPGAGSHTFAYDSAGNLTTTTTPRGHTVAVSYDELNRPIRKILSQVDYANIGCPAFSGGCQQFSFPTREGSSVCLASDTSFFDYDAAGNLRRADNGWAWVRRAYTPSGLVSHDTLVIRTYETSAPYPCGDGDRHSGGVAAGTADFTSHVYALRFTYDLAGRRDSLLHPDGIDFCSGRCATRYAYESATGLLSTVTDPLNYTTTFAYDAAGRDTATTYPGSVVMRRSYDADGGVIGRHGPFTNGDTLRLDAQGRLISGTIGDIADNGQADIRLRYGALGAVVYAYNLTGGATYEEDSVDALGNRLWQRDYGVRPDYMDRHRRLFLDNATGRLDSIKVVPPQPTGYPVDGDTVYALNRYHIAHYDATGNSHQTYGWPNPTLGGSGWDAALEEAVSYFDAEERLRIFNRHVDYGQVSGPGGVYEEYRYDALGRRVLVRSRCTASPNSSSYCRGYLERTVWDGDQVLYELRAPGQDSASAEAMENDAYAGASPATNYDALLGRVGYVHAQGIDAPLAVYRMGMAGQPSPIGVAPHANFQGVFEIGSLIGGSYSGQSTRSCQGYSGCPTILWPGGYATLDGETPSRGAVETWFGNLLSQKSDGSGLQYMRNRYYDPRTGRFTQSDPIGLAGGLNLYGFASGDPVNFGDPFGLCPIGQVCIRYTFGHLSATRVRVGQHVGPGDLVGLSGNSGHVKGSGGGYHVHYEAGTVSATGGYTADRTASVANSGCPAGSCTGSSVTSQPAESRCLEGETCRAHNGIDVAVPNGTDVRFADDGYPGIGEVVNSGWQKPQNHKKGFGLRVTVDVPVDRP